MGELARISDSLFGNCGGPEESRWGCGAIALFGSRVLGDGLGALADCVLGQLSGKQQTYRGLHFAAGDGGFLVIVGETRRLCRDPLEDIVDEAVHNTHGATRDSRVGMDLFHDLVDVDAVTLLTRPSPLLVSGSRDSAVSGLLLTLSACFRRHGEIVLDCCEFKME